MKSLSIHRHIEIDSTYRNRELYPNPTEFVVNLGSGQKELGLSAIDPISKQVVLFPPQNPIGASQLQLEPIAFFEDTLLDTNTIEERRYLPYMFIESGASDTLIRLDELPIASTDPTNTSIEPSTDLPRNTIPLGRADNFYVDNFLENVETGEIRKIIGFSYSDTPETLQTVTVISYSVSGTSVLVELEMISDNSVIPSNVDRFYQGKTIEFADESQRLIINYYLNDIGNPVVQLDSPLISAPAMGSPALIIASETWLARIESAFSTTIPPYPAYREPTLGSNIIYEKMALLMGDRIFALESVRHSDNTVGIVFQTSTRVGYIYSTDTEGTTWSDVVEILSFPVGFAELGDHGIDVSIISDGGPNSYPAVVFGSDDSAPAILNYTRATDTRGTLWNAPSEVVIIEIVSGVNDTLDIDTGSGSTIVTLTAGNYNDLASLASEIATEMTAQSSPTHTFAAAFDSSRVLTITDSTGTFQFAGSTTLATQLGYSTFPSGFSASQVASTFETVSHLVEIGNGLVRIQPIPAQGVNGTASTTDAGFPEIVVSDADGDIISIIRGRSLDGGTLDNPTWTQDFLVDNPIPGEIADIGTYVDVSTTRYDNGALADDLMSRTAFTYKFTQTGYIIRIGDDAFTTNLGTATIDDGFYSTLESIRLALETQLQSIDVNFSVTLTGDTFTVTNTINFDIIPTDLSRQLGFGNVTLTGNNTYTASPNNLYSTADNQLGLVTRDSNNNRWVIDNIFGTNQADGFQSFSEVSATIPVGTEGVAVEREVKLLVLVYKNTSGTIITHKQTFINASSSASYRGFFNPTFITEINSNITRLDPKITDFANASDNIYPTSSNPITITYLNNDTLENTDFVTNTLVVENPYTAETADNINIFDTIINDRNDAPLLIFQSQDKELNVMIPKLNTFLVGVQYRIRDGIPAISSDSSTILGGSTTRLTVSSSVASSIPDTYVGSFLHVYNKASNPIPNPYTAFNDYRKVIKYSGNTTDTSVSPPLPPYTFLVGEAFSGDISATLATNFNVAPDRTSIIINGTTYTIASGTYADIAAVVTAIDAVLPVAYDVSETGGIVTITNTTPTEFEITQTLLSQSLGFFGDQTGSDSYTGSSVANFVNLLDWELLQFSHDNFTPLMYVGTDVGVNQPVCYEIELSSLILPNVTLSSGQGNRIAFYPYVYVEFTNLSAQKRNVLISNNPNAGRATFRVPITNTVDPERSTFVQLSGKGTHTLPFKPNDSFQFRVFLSNGELFTTLETDTSPPFSPDPNIQVSASFAIRRVVGNSGCGPK